MNIPAVICEEEGLPTVVGATKKHSPVIPQMVDLLRHQYDTAAIYVYIFLLYKAEAFENFNLSEFIQ